MGQFIELNKVGDSKKTNFTKQANFGLPIAYNTFAVQRDVITFSQTQEKKIDFQVMKLIISVWSGSGNCSFSFC